MGRIFKDCFEMIREMDRELKVSGITVPVNHYQNQELSGDDRLTKELIGVSFVISKPYLGKREMLDFMFKDEAELIEKYCRAELSDRLDRNGVNPGKSWEIRRDLWLEDHDHCSSGVRVVPESHDDIIQLVYFGSLVENVQTLRIGVVETTLLPSLAHQLLPQVLADFPAFTGVDSVSVKPVGELCSAILLDELGLILEHEVEHLTFAEIRL